MRVLLSPPKLCLRRGDNGDQNGRMPVPGDGRLGQAQPSFSVESSPGEVSE